LRPEVDLYWLELEANAVKIIEYLNHSSRNTLVLLGFVLVICIGELDYVTGPMVALMIFYLIPICFVAWFVGRWASFFIAFVSCAIWFGAKYLEPGSIDNHPLLLWNALQRLGIFALSAVLTAEVAERKRVEQALRQAQEGLETRVQERTQELARANDSLQKEVLERTEAQKELRLLNDTLEQRVAERTAAAGQRAQELARSEAALRQQTSILQSILNSMGDGVIVTDAQGKILLLNPAARRLVQAGLGTTAPGAASDRDHIYLPDALTAYPTREHPLLRAIRGEIVDGAEIYLRQSDSSDGLWLSATGRPLIDEHGCIQGGVVVYTDMSARKLMEKQVAEISDREQRRIGQDLHDSLCQHLVSIGFAAELLRDQLARHHLSEAAQAEVIADMVNGGISQARHLARGLYPVRLELDGLASALEELTETVHARGQVACHFSFEEQVLIYDEVAGGNLFRIAQEAINNAVKHAHCRHISVALGAVDDEVILTVKDDGVGFASGPQSHSGMGLHIMNYRAKMIGASLDIRRGVGGGTIVLCSFHNKRLPGKDARCASKAEAPPGPAAEPAGFHLAQEK
jgi:signal transduction histidine kinase